MECDNDSLKTLSKRGIKQELLNNGIEKENEDEKERERKRERQRQRQRQNSGNRNKKSPPNFHVF